MRFGPPVGFARRPDGRKLAYQVLGDGELDLVFVPGHATHLGLQWEEPSVAGFLHKLAAFSRLILLDRLGNGLSMLSARLPPVVQADATALPLLAGGIEAAVAVNVLDHLADPATPSATT